MRDTDPQQFLEHLRTTGIIPHVDEIMDIALAGGVAVLVFEATPKWATALRNMGGTGKLETHVFRLSPDGEKTLAKADAVTKRWIERKHSDPENPIARIFVAAHDGASLLVNFEPGKGFSIEPGSLTPQVLN